MSSPFVSPPTQIRTYNKNLRRRENRNIEKNNDNNSITGLDDDDNDSMDEDVRKFLEEEDCNSLNQNNPLKGINLKY